MTNSWAGETAPHFYVNGWTVFAPSVYGSGFWQALKGSEQFVQAWTKRGLLKKLGVK